jgi:hypothetical protein
MRQYPPRSPKARDWGHPHRGWERLLRPGPLAGGATNQWENHGDPWDPNDDVAPGYARPVDALDGCFYDHDKCYTRARNPRVGQRCTKQYDQATTACDFKLAQCAAQLSEAGMSVNEARFRELTVDTFATKSILGLLGMWGDR